ncbi:MAG: hypothetical protein E4H14_07475 [Candidatus Thorarchaeota archaeon]|nr:MAG: hypothetical protein E4H14_07475 [Candidatus Thorarchaeota archaeon]
MKRKKQVATLFTIFFVFVTFLGTTPMALFYIIEGGGGGTTPTWPKTWQESVLVDDSGSWTDDRYAAWSMIETEDYIASLRVVLSEKNDYYRRSMLQLSTFYTFKGERTHDWMDIDGVLNTMRIEVQKGGSYSAYMDGSWTTSETSRGVSPQWFTSDDTVSWSPVAEVLVGTLIDVAIDVATSSTVAGIAVGLFVDTIMAVAADSKVDSVNNIGLGSDTTGHYMVENIDPQGHKYYGGTIGPDGDGWQHAYDFSSHCELRTGWTSSIPNNGYQSWKFRVISYAHSFSGYDATYSPWIYVGIIT